MNLQAKEITASAAVTLPEEMGCAALPKVFSPQEVLEAFGMDWLKFSDAARWMIGRLHPSGAWCPACSESIIDETRVTRFFAFEQVRCPACGKKFSATTGTFIEGAKLEAREIILLAVLLALDVSPARIASLLRVHIDTVRNWRDRFSAMAEVAQG